MPVLAVTFADLLEVVWVSTLAGVGITILFSLVILTTARAGDARRGGHGGAAAGYAVAAALTFAVFAGGVIYGVHVMLSG